MECETDRELYVVYRCFFFFQAEDGIRDLVRSRGLGDVYKRQVSIFSVPACPSANRMSAPPKPPVVSVDHDS